MHFSLCLCLLPVFGSASFVGKPFQMVDGSGRYQSKVADYISSSVKSGFGTEERQVAIVASLGGKGSVKSTLLNSVFGTQFSTDGQGAWISTAAQAPHVLVLDTDSDTDVENDDVKIASLSLSLADVLIVNRRHSNLGRSDPSTYDTFRTLFKDQLSAGQSGSRTLILYVNHDHDDAASTAEVRDIVMKEMQAIWNSIPRSPENKATALADLFDFEFVSLPHHRYRKEEFKRAVQSLQEKFDISRGSVCLLREEYSKLIDPGTLASHADKVWGELCEEYDALPPPSELRDRYWADSAFELASQTVDAQLKQWQTQIYSKKAVKDFGQAAADLLESSAQLFISKAESCRDVEMKQSKAEELEVDTRQQLVQMLNRQIQMLIVQGIAQYKRMLVQLVSRQGNAQDWQKSNIMNNVERKFAQSAAPLIIPDMGIDLGDIKDKFSTALVDFAKKFGDSSTMQFHAMEAMKRKAAAPQPKQPRGVVLGLGLTGMLRTSGPGNIQSFAGYNHGPHSAHVMFANDNEESNTAARVQPKLNFDIQL